MRRLPLTIILALLPVMAHSATYTVSTQGSDNNPGTAQSPWRTIQKATNTAVAGDVVNILPGTYVERVTIANSGSSGNPITFQGVRGSSGSWDTTIDGSSSTSGWVAAPEVGSGVWKATLGSPQAMMSDGKTIWRITDNIMASGQGFTTLRRDASSQVETAFGTVLHWDGIEALFGNLSGTTYLRFRNGDNPSTRNVRVAPAKGTVTIDGKNHIVLKDLRILGGQWQVNITGGAQNTLVQDCDLRTGQRRVTVANAANTTLHRNRMDMYGLGTQAFPPGDREPGIYARVVNRHQYDENKFTCGDTDTNDASIMVVSNASNTTISENEIAYGMLGMQISETTTDTLIINNTFHNFSDSSIYIYPDSATITATGNLFYDADHHFRHNNMHRDITTYIYANRFHEPNYNGQGGGGKHIHLSPSQNNTATMWIYHNTFTGGGWAVDAGCESSPCPTFPNVHILNNLLSVNGMSSSGGPSGAEIGSNMTTGIWFNDTLPSFVLPPGHAGLNSAPSLIARGLPGMTTAYYQEGQSDYGAIQGPSQSTMPPPTRLRATIK